MCGASPVMGGMITHGYGYGVVAWSSCVEGPHGLHGRYGGQAGVAHTGPKQQRCLLACFPLGSSVYNTMAMELFRMIQFTISLLST